MAEKDVKLRLLVEVVDDASKQLVKVSHSIDQVTKSLAGVGKVQGPGNVNEVVASLTKNLGAFERNAKNWQSWWGNLGKVGKPLEETNLELKKQSSTIGDLSTAFSGLNAVWFKATAALYVVSKAIGVVSQQMEIGAKALAVEQAFTSVTESLLINGDKMIEKMQEVSYAIVDSTSVQNKAMRMLSEGIGESQIVELMEASRVAARLMGTDVESAFERVSDAIILMRMRGIKAAFPMDLVEVTDRYAKSIGTVSKYLSEYGQRQAVIVEIQRQAKEKADLLGGALVPNVYEKLQKVSSAWSEFRSTIGKSFAVKLEPVVDGLLLMIDLQKKANKEWAALPDTVKTAVDSIATSIIGTLIPSFGPLLVILNKLKQMREKKEAKTPAQELEEAQNLYTVLENKYMAQDALNKRKYEEDYKNFKLANEQAMQQSINEINLAGLEKAQADRMAQLDIQQARERVAAKTLFSDITHIEYEQGIVKAGLAEKLAVQKAELERVAALKMIDAKEKAELEANKQAGMPVKEIQERIAKERVAVESKTAASVEKIRSDSAVKIANLIEGREGALGALRLEAEKAVMEQSRKEWGSFVDDLMAATPQAMQAAELAAKEFSLAQRKVAADYNVQLETIVGSYDSITDAQVEVLNAERAAVLQTGEGARNHEIINELYDARIKKLVEIRALEADSEIFRLKRELAEMRGDWNGMYQAQIDSLEAGLRMQLVQNGMTEEAKKLTIEIYEWKKGLVEAEKNMDVAKLALIGIQERVIAVRQELVDTFKNTLVESVKAFSTTFGTFFSDLLRNDLKTASDYFQMFMNKLVDMFSRSIEKMLENWLTDFVAELAKGQKGKGILEMFGLGKAKPEAVASPATSAVFGVEEGMAGSVSGTVGALAGLDTELKQKPKDIEGVSSALGGMDLSLEEATGILEGMGTTAGVVVGDMGSSFDDLWSNMPSLMEEGLSGVEGVAEEVFGDLGGTIGGLLGGLGGSIESTFSTIVDTVSGLLKGLVGGGGGGGGGGGLVGIFGTILSLFGLQKGGRVTGKAGPDKVPIMATAGEYVLRKEAVEKMGLPFIEMLNRGVFDISELVGMMVSNKRRVPISTPARYFQEGGLVRKKEKDEKVVQELTIVNVVDSRQMDQWAASAAGQHSIINVISANAGTVTRLLR